MDRVMEFDGRTAGLFAEYVAYKRAMGYRIPVSYQYVLHEINRRLESCLGEERPIEIGRADMERICARREGEAVPTQCKRITILRQFCLFMRTRGLDATPPPPGMVRDVSDFVPHVLSRAEMAACIGEADRDPHPWAGLAARLSCCCGLRMGEICSLGAADVDPEAGTVLVRRSKGDRTRPVPMSRSVSLYVAEYMESNGLVHADGSVPLIIRRDGRRWAPGNAGAVMKACMARAGLRTRSGSVPRPHDARHGFAVRALEQMEERGYDPYVALPLLAQYMGHADIKSTERYLRFAEGSYAAVLEALDPTSRAVFGGDAE